MINTKMKLFSNLSKSTSFINKNFQNYFLNKFSGLYKLQTQNIVDIRFKKNSVFQQYDLNPYHLSYTRKKKQNDLIKKVMYDENVKWEHDPTNYPAAVKEIGLNLIKKIESEEMAKIKSNKLRRDKISLGDKVEIEYYESITNKKLHKYKGVIIELKRPNSLTHSFKILLNLNAENYIAEYPWNSPMLHSVKLIGKVGYTKKTKIFNARDLAKYGNKVERLLEGGKKLSINKKDLKQMKLMELNSEQIVIE